VRPLFSTRRRRLVAPVTLYGGAILFGLPLAASQILVGTITSSTREPWPPWEETSVSSAGLRLRAWGARGEPGRRRGRGGHGRHRQRAGAPARSAASHGPTRALSRSCSRAWGSVAADQLTVGDSGRKFSITQTSCSDSLRRPESKTIRLPLG
jgi:hypothetical protein